MKNIAICVYTTNISILKDYLYKYHKLKMAPFKGKYISKCVLCNVLWRLYKNNSHEFSYEIYFKCDRCNLSINRVVFPVPTIVHKLFV